MILYTAPPAYTDKLGDGGYLKAKARVVLMDVACVGRLAALRGHPQPVELHALRALFTGSRDVRRVVGGALLTLPLQPLGPGNVIRDPTVESIFFTLQLLLGAQGVLR